MSVNRKVTVPVGSPPLPSWAANLLVSVSCSRGSHGDDTRALELPQNITPDGSSTPLSWFAPDVGAEFDQ